MDNNIEKLNNIIEAYASKEVVFTNDLNLVDDLGFDSIVIMEIVIKIEQEFDFEFDHDLLLFENIASYAFLSELMNKVIKGELKDYVE